MGRACPGGRAVGQPVPSATPPDLLTGWLVEGGGGGRHARVCFHSPGSKRLKNLSENSTKNSKKNCERLFFTEFFQRISNRKLFLPRLSNKNLSRRKPFATLGLPTRNSESHPRALETSQEGHPQDVPWTRAQYWSVSGKGWCRGSLRMMMLSSVGGGGGMSSQAHSLTSPSVFLVVPVPWLLPEWPALCNRSEGVRSA